MTEQYEKLHTTAMQSAVPIKPKPSPKALEEFKEAFVACGTHAELHAVEAQAKAFVQTFKDKESDDTDLAASSDGKPPETVGATSSDQRADAQAPGDKPSRPLPYTAVAEPDRE